MARLSRLTLPGYVHHVVQRGNNQQHIFSDDDDYLFFLDLLGELSARHGVSIHAYVLRQSEYHFLLTPETDKSLPQMMQALGRHYVRYYNAKHGRSGTLWEGRYRSTLIQPERYLLAAMVDMDLSPVRDGLVAQARDYPWSSHVHYIGLRTDRLITPHPVYWTLGNTPFARQLAYETCVRRGNSQELSRELSDSVRFGWVLGDAAYVAELQEKTNRRLGRLKAGRPRRGPSAAEAMN